MNRAKQFCNLLLNKIILRTDGHIKKSCIISRHVCIMCLKKYIVPFESRRNRWCKHFFLRWAQLDGARDSIRFITKEWVGFAWSSPEVGVSGRKGRKNKTPRGFCGARSPRPTTTNPSHNNNWSNFDPHTGLNHPLSTRKKETFPFLLLNHLLGNLFLQRRSNYRQLFVWKLFLDRVLRGTSARSNCLRLQSRFDYLRKTPIEPSNRSYVNISRNIPLKDYRYRAATLISIQT